MGVVGQACFVLAITGPGCQAIERGEFAGHALTVSRDITEWPKNRLIDMKFATIDLPGFANAEYHEVCVTGVPAAGAYCVLCGIESEADAGAKFYLTPRNHAAGQPPEPDPQGPGMRHTEGWSFITFKWPLIWVRNIDAGSIGTTAIMRWQEINGIRYLSLYLVRNGKLSPLLPPSEDEGGHGDAETIASDETSGLFLNAGYPFPSMELYMPAGKEIVRVRFFEGGSVPDRMIPVRTSPGVWEQISFDVTEDELGAITVTATDPAGDADCAFLAGVLRRAQAEAIYTLPADPPSPPPSP
ncbi:MAG: hypothetical protein DYG94_02735 [Leptolyngbya sp. PLA3]|nr:MAG: hypothetical protein EDM82_11560 [Cyanobacteria bacterium CYA]MCE7967644.1 hypothetical protein [Leptolyngbya sp. PL-A3]